MRKSSIALWIGSRVYLSFFAVLIGWIVGTSLLALSGLWGTGDHLNLLYFAEGTFVIGLAMAPILSGVWLLIVLPLALLIPAESHFLKHGPLTLCGIIAGPVIFVAYLAICSGGMATLHGPFISKEHLYAFFFVFLVPACVGGVTGYIAAILNRRSLTPSRHSG